MLALTAVSYKPTQMISCTHACTHTYNSLQPRNINENCVPHAHKTYRENRPLFASALLPSPRSARAYGWRGTPPNHPTLKSTHFSKAEMRAACPSASPRQAIACTTPAAAVFVPEWHRDGGAGHEKLAKAFIASNRGGLSFPPSSGMPSPLPSPHPVGNPRPGASIGRTTPTSC